ncbi:hypothetical protein, partial [uncultured Microbacterium sp.]|uniref:hypothetical protein n=1 Tax=uncultured Microbacterium sp. TaxID=191216 RepID=UPI0025D28C39
IGNRRLAQRPDRMKGAAHQHHVHPAAITLPPTFQISIPLDLFQTHELSPVESLPSGRQKSSIGA